MIWLLIEVLLPLYIVASQVHKLSAGATSGNLEAVHRNTLLPLRIDTNRKTSDLMAYAKSQSDRVISI